MCILPFSLNRKCELLRVNLTVKQRLPDCCWKESAAHMWVPKGCWGGKSISGHFLKIAAVNYLGTLVYEFSLQCIKASNHKDFFFLNFNLVQNAGVFIFIFYTELPIHRINWVLKPQKCLLKYVHFCDVLLCLPGKSRHCASLVFIPKCQYWH